jgi:hypothetical protein
MSRSSFEVIPLGTRTVRLVATLTDSAGNLLAGKTISFAYKLSSATTWTDAGTATTGSDGKATKDVTVSTPNTYDFKADFAGDDQYEASSAIISNYTVKEKTTLTLTVQPL